MKNSWAFIPLIAVAFLSCSNPSGPGDSGPGRNSSHISDNYISVIVFDDNEIETKQINLGNVLSEYWLQGLVHLKQFHSNQISINFRSSILTVKADNFEIISLHEYDGSINYLNRLVSYWEKIMYLESTITWEQAESDSFATSALLWEHSISETGEHLQDSLLHLLPNRIAPNRLRVPLIENVHNDLVFTRTITYNLIKDSTETYLFANPYFTDYQVRKRHEQAEPELILNFSLEQDQLQKNEVTYIIGLVSDRYVFLSNGGLVYCFDTLENSITQISQNYSYNYRYLNIWAHTVITDDRLFFIDGSSIAEYIPALSSRKTLYSDEKFNISNDFIINISPDGGKLYASYTAQPVGTMTNDTHQFIKEIDLTNGTVREIYGKRALRQTLISNVISVDGKLLGLIHRYDL